MNLRDRLVVPPRSARVDLSAIDPRSTPGFTRGRALGVAATDELGVRLAELQDRLYANGRTGDARRVVLVLQAMDSGGKDGSVRHVVGYVNPAGVRVASFGKPTAQELAHDIFWRVENQLPEAGMLAVFNRSHYEDVLIVRVHDLVPRRVWSRRYARINAWESKLAGQGVTMLKVFLHISYEEQRKRLLARLDDPTKLWKVNPADLTERGFWSDYQQAYEVALQKCSTDVAPWFVIPADSKWYRNWALAQLLVETLEGLGQGWPLRPDLDLAGLRCALRES